VVADSAEAALALFVAGGFVALITDYRLPGKSGAELILEIRRLGANIPSVVMSAYSDDDTIRVSRTAGARAVLGKPVELGTLMSLVDQFNRSDA
jgi:two-component system, chemotaxis family, chemotaxis protein CheY